MDQVPSIDQKARPDVFYKFMSLRTEKLVKRLRDGFRNNRIWLSNRAEFNDPFDSRPVINIAADRDVQIAWMARKYQERGDCADFEEARHRATIAIEGSQGKEDSISREVEARLLDHLNGVGILCLAGNRDSLLMWSHYADSHRGICLGFQTRRQFDLFDAVRKVKYQLPYPEIAAFEDDDATKLAKALLTKSKCWEYEQEYRILNHIRCNYCEEYEPGNLVSITFGALIDPEIRDELVTEVRSTACEAQLDQACLARNEFRLTYEPLG